MYVKKAEYEYLLKCKEFFENKKEVLRIRNKSESSIKARKKYNDSHREQINAWRRESRRAKKIVEGGSTLSF